MTRIPSALVRHVLLGCVAAALSMLWVPTVAAHALAGGVSVHGVVVNGSRSDEPVAGRTVLLTMIAGGQEQQIGSVTSDAHGSFAVDQADLDPSASYVLTTDFAGGTFATPELTADDLTTRPQTLRIYDTTTDDGGISAALVTMVIGAPNQRTGRISVAENVTFSNSGSRAYLATVQPANGRPMNLLRFALPSGASNLVLGAGFATGQSIEAPAGFGLATTVPPGNSEFAFAFDLPYDGTAITIPFKTEYPANQVLVLLPTTLHVDAGEFIVKPSVQAAGSRYQVIERTGMAAGTSSSYRLSGLPMPGETAYLSAGALLAVGIALVILMALLLSLYLRRGALPALRGVDAFSLPLRGNDRAQRRNDLLHEHVALDELRSAGKVGDAAYHERRERLRDELRTLITPERLGGDLPTIDGVETGGEEDGAIERQGPDTHTRTHAEAAKGEAR